MPKYPEIHVQLSGNAFAILGNVSKELRRGGVSKEDRDAFLKEATAGDYNALLNTCSNWVDVS